MARRSVHIFTSFNKTLHSPLSSYHFCQLLSKELGSTPSLGWCSQIVFTFCCFKRFSTAREFSVQFFPLYFFLQLLLLSSLLLQIFMHCHSQAKVQVHKKLNGTARHKSDAAFSTDDSFYLLASSFCISFQLLSMNLSA